MGKYYKWKVLLILIVIGLSVWQVWPPQEKIHLGLDLQGGMQLLLKVDLNKVPPEGRKDATDRVVEIIRNRIDQLGVREPIISKQAKDEVVVQLPGITDRERAKEIVGKTAHLEFKVVAEDPDLIAKAEAAMLAATEPAKTEPPKAEPPKAETLKTEAPKTEPAKTEPAATSASPAPAASASPAPAAASKPAPPPVMPEGYEYLPMKDRNGRTENLLLKKESILTGDHLVNSSVGFDQYGEPIVRLQYDPEGAKIFDRFTYQNIGRRLAIVLDGVVHSAPVIRDRIPNGEAQISGSFSAQEASDLALVLRAAPSPRRSRLKKNGPWARVSAAIPSPKASRPVCWERFSFSDSWRFTTFYPVSSRTSRF